MSIMTKLSDKQIEKYSRQIIIDSFGISGQKKIIGTKVLIIGCGGLGTSAAQYLSMAGIGKLGLVDDDCITLSNLNRQTLFTEDDIGKKKVEVLEKKIKNINPESSIFKLKTRLKRSNIKKTFSDYHYILDCSDNFHTRFLINEFCHKMKRVLVTAALQNFDLQAAIFKSWEGINPCYECFFSSDNKYPQDSCDQMGIVATVAGIGGALQGQLLINNVLNKQTNFSQIILFSGSKIRMRKIGFNKNQSCKICKSS